MENNIEIRKPDDQLVIGRIPAWILFGGNMIILTVLMLLLFISFKMTFPVMVHGSVYVSGENIYVRIPIKQQNKIKEGQSIHLSIDDFPNSEYGVLQGEVFNLGKAKEENNSLYVPVKLNDSINRIHHSDIVEGMNGSGDIIVDRIPVIYKIIQLKKLPV